VRATLSADPELATGAQAVLSEAHALLEELGRDPAAGELVTRGREQLDAALGGLLRDDAATARVVAKLQSKLGENREALQALARDWAPGLLASLNEAVDSSGGLTVAEAVAAVQSRAQAAGASVRADALLELAGSAPHEQQHGAPVTVDMLVQDQLLLRVVPSVKAHAGNIAGKVREFREDKATQQALLSRAIAALSLAQQQQEQQQQQQQQEPSPKGENPSARGIIPFDASGAVDAEGLIDLGERIVRDERARAEFIGKVKDAVLDFLLGLSSQRGDSADSQGSRGPEVHHLIGHQERNHLLRFSD
jgi:hypothetical protein